MVGIGIINKYADLLDRQLDKEDRENTEKATKTQKYKTLKKVSDRLYAEYQKAQGKLQQLQRVRGWEEKRNVVEKFKKEMLLANLESKDKDKKVKQIIKKYNLL